MNIRDLRIFQEVANCGSINQAAQRLNYAQSNITSRIQKLEKDLNVQLFRRHPKGVSLTNEGKALIPYVQQMISLSEKMKMIASNQDLVGGELKIASVETVIELPLILATYIKRYEQVDLTLSTGVTAQLRDEVLEYKLDGAFVTKSNMINDPQLEQVEVFDEKLVIISNKKDRPLDEIMREPIIRFSEGCMYRAKLNEWFFDQGEVPSKTMELGTLETMINSVISGLGIAYIPYEVAERYIEDGYLYHYELPKQYSKISTVFIYRKSQYVTPALQKLIETIDEIRERLLTSQQPLKLSDITEG